MSIYREVSWKLHIVEVMRTGAFRNMKVASTLSHGRLPVINYVISHPGCTQQEIADTTDVSAPAITAAVKRLEKDGLITKTADTENLRKNKLYATPAGIEAAQVCHGEIAEINSRFYRNFSDEELLALNGYLEKMIESYSGEKYDCRRMREFLESTEKKCISQEDQND